MLSLKFYWFPGVLQEQSSDSCTTCDLGCQQRREHVFLSTSRLFANGVKREDFEIFSEGDNAANVFAGERLGWIRVRANRSDQIY